MGEWNTNALPQTIWTGGRFSLCVGSRATAAGSGQFVSTAWGTANLAIAIPVFLPFRYPVRNLFVYNFATVAGNVDAGIYNKDLVLIASAGTTLMAGATGLQFFPKDITLEPGTYYLAMSSSSTTATFACNVGLGTATRERYLGMLQMATALPLPATLTAAAVANARVPLIGMSKQSGTPNF